MFYSEMDWVGCQQFQAENAYSVYRGDGPSPGEQGEGALFAGDGGPSPGGSGPCSPGLYGCPGSACSGVRPGHEPEGPHRALETSE